MGLFNKNKRNDSANKVPSELKNIITSQLEARFYGTPFIVLYEEETREPAMFYMHEGRELKNGKQVKLVKLDGERKDEVFDGIVMPIPNEEISKNCEYDVIVGINGKIYSSTIENYQYNRIPQADIHLEELSQDKINEFEENQSFSNMGNQPVSNVVDQSNYNLEEANEVDSFILDENNESAF